MWRGAGATFSSQARTGCAHPHGYLCSWNLLALPAQRPLGLSLQVRVTLQLPAESRGVTLGFRPAQKEEVGQASVELDQLFRAPSGARSGCQHHEAHFLPGPSFPELSWSSLKSRRGGWGSTLMALSSDLSCAPFPSPF